MPHPLINGIGSHIETSRSTSDWDKLISIYPTSPTNKLVHDFFQTLLDSLAYYQRNCQQLLNISHHVENVNMKLRKFDFCAFYHIPK
ncbi:hypothetical protein TNCV_375021 [Trichonephila clavipes]|nr:hypothetical protein TNCV_375021 [Trichonephila clavipes]